jgi:hypothetical protein
MTEKINETQNQEFSMEVTTGSILPRVRDQSLGIPGQTWRPDIRK